MDLDKERENVQIREIKELDSGDIISKGVSSADVIENKEDSNKINNLNDYIANEFGKEIRGEKIPPEYTIERDEEVIVPDNTGILPFVPNSAQNKFAMLVLRGEFKNYKDASKKIGVSVSTIKDWFKNDAFCIWLETLRRRMFILNKPMIDRTVIRKAKEGKNFKWVELYYKIEGTLNKSTNEDSFIFGDFEKNDVQTQFVIILKKMRNILGLEGENS